MRRLVSLLFGLMVLSGCYLGSQTTRSGSFSSEARLCAEVRLSPEAAKSGSGQRKTAATDRERVLVALCPEFEDVVGDVHGGTYVTRYQTTILPTPQAIHESFDLRVPDTILAATMVLSIAATERGEENIRRSQLPDRADQFDYLVGLGLVYRDFIEQTELQRRLRETRLPEDALSAYLAVLAKALVRLETHAQSMLPDKRTVLVDGPRQLVAKLRRELVSQAPRAAQLEKLGLQAESAQQPASRRAIAAAIGAFRRELVSTCGGMESCLAHPLVIESSRQLVLLYMGTGQRALARAESSFLNRPGSLRERFQVALFHATSEAAERSTDAWHRREAAKIPDGVLARALGTPVDFGAVRVFAADDRMPFWAHALDPSQDPPEQGVVASKQKDGELISLRFRAERITFDEEYDCRKTGRPSRIQVSAPKRSGVPTWSASVEYEEVCKYRQSTKELPALSRVRVPIADAAGIAPGDRVTFWREGTDLGAVIEVHRGRHMRQLRDLSLSLGIGDRSQ